MELLRLSGEAARPYCDELAELRVRIFWDFPYLYEGTLAYERRYLETYFQAKHSFILLLKDQGRVIGATTGIHASEEEESFRTPFIKAGFDPSRVFYFGESVLDKSYRGKGLGKVFFAERETYARSLGFIDVLSFCAVVRPSEHALMPTDYKPLDEFWLAQGFQKQIGMTTHYSWLDRGETQETEKLMQYWTKSIGRGDPS